MMKNLLKKLNAGLMTVAMSTMVMLPVAQGKQAAENFDKVTKAQLEEAIVSMGLNKSMTFGEFFKKNKDKFPTRVQQMMGQMVSRFKDEPMPQFEVYTTQNSQGEQVANVRISGKSQLSNVQFLGETNKFVKFDNTNLTEEDIANFDDMMTKLYYTDATHRKGMGDAVSSPKTLKNTKKKSVRNGFQGYPKITKQLWKKLTPMERARFMINLRVLYSSAQEVVDKADAKNINSKGKKTSLLEKWNLFFAMLDEANAGGTPGKGCVIAGYTGIYNSKGSCDYDNSSGDYDAAKQAAGCRYPCNPTIYGFNAQNKPFCVPSFGALQTATHFGGSCDGARALTSQQLALPAKDAPQGSERYSEEIIAKNREAALNDPNFESLTKAYLESMLKAQNPDLVAAFQKGELSDALIAQLKTIQDNFNSTIQNARSKCAEAAAEKKQETNFLGACDQLHKRFLFVGAYLDKSPGCTTGETAVDPVTLTCACPNGSPVAPGAQCGAGGTPNEPTPGGTSDTTVVGDEAGVVCEKPCKDNEKCVADGEYDGVKNPGKCVKEDGSTDKEKPSIWSKIWGGIKKAAPWVLGAGALYLLWKHVFKVKKPKLNPAADACPNGSIPPCGQICTAPQALLSSGVCGCTACPPGQTQTNASTCLCETTTTTPTTYICADGVTQVTDLTLCPTTTTYTCWDGSTVTNPINCPEQPVSKPGGSTR